MWREAEFPHLDGDDPVQLIMLTTPESDKRCKDDVVQSQLMIEACLRAWPWKVPCTKVLHEGMTRLDISVAGMLSKGCSEWARSQAVLLKELAGYVRPSIGQPPLRGRTCSMVARI